MVKKTTEVTTYIAEDGTSFVDEQSCRSYESRLMLKLLSESADIIENIEARGFCPLDNDIRDDMHNHKWFKPLNKTGLNLIGKITNETLTDDSLIGKWICLQSYLDEYTFCSTLENSIAYAKEMLDKFDIKILSENTHQHCSKSRLKGSQKEICHLNDQELEYMITFAKYVNSDANDNHKLRLLRSLWTAYCLHNDYDIDTKNYTDSLDKIWDALKNNSHCENREKFNSYMQKHLL